MLADLGRGGPTCLSPGRWGVRPGAGLKGDRGEGEKGGAEGLGAASWWPLAGGLEEGWG